MNFHQLDMMALEGRDWMADFYYGLPMWLATMLVLGLALTIGSSCTI